MAEEVGTLRELAMTFLYSYTAYLGFKERCTKYHPILMEVDMDIEV
jgi:hypothetical protein